jgi:hypothetical protein
VASIVHAKQAGPPLPDIRAFLTAGDPAARKDVLRRHHRTLQARMAALRSALDLLEAGLNCTHEDMTSCPNFQAQRFSVLGRGCLSPPSRRRSQLVRRLAHLPDLANPGTRCSALNEASRAVHRRPVGFHCADPAVADGVAGPGVAAAPHRCRQAVLPAVPDDDDHIGGTSTPGDQGPPPLHVAVPDLTSGVEASVVRLDQVAREVRGQRSKACTIDGCRWHLPEPWHGS